MSGTVSNYLAVDPALETNRLGELAVRMMMRAAMLGGLRNRLSILIYHRVLPQTDPLFPEQIDAQRFDRQIAHLRTCFNVIPLGEAVRGLQSGRLPARAACITFDDGYADNEEIALPILQKHGVSATFFIATGFLNGKRMWNDTVIDTVRHAPGDLLDLHDVGYGSYSIASAHARRQAIDALLDKLKYLAMDERQQQVDALWARLGREAPQDLMMTTAQVRALHAAGMEVGGHTVNHPILARVDATAAAKEIGSGKETLEAMIGAPVRLFAYPNGGPGRDYLAAHVALVKQMGFDAAVSTSWGCASPRSDLFQLPRFTPWDRTPGRFALRMAQNLYRNGTTV